MNKKIKLSLLASLLATTLGADESISNITITSTPFKTTETGATSSVELYTSEDIKKSKSSDIYEFLSEQTSITTMPASGNIFTQKLDLRGFGITDGYQNIVVVVDGRRLNNVDQVPQLLSSIPINTIEKIEILKGSGSVVFGDNATAGVISITTNSKYDNSISGYIGNNNTKSRTMLLGHNNEKLLINGMIDYYSTDGSRQITTDGKTDEKTNKNKKIDIKYFPKDELELRVNRSFTKIDNIYANGMTPANFEQDPSQLGKLTSGKNYSSQLLNSYNTGLGATYYINTNSELHIDSNIEDKVNDNPVPYDWKNEYEIKNINSTYKLKKDDLKLAVGVNKDNTKRIGSSDKVSKINQGIFVSSDYSLDKKTTLNAGLRYEEVKYIYDKNDGSVYNEAKEYITAYNFGASHIINQNQSIFANYNKAFQAPDVDRFFNFGGAFNGFIDTALSKTLNIGFNDFRNNNKFKATVFRSNLTNEIYYHKSSYTNTNIDKSHKYGLEIFDKYKINKNYYTSLNYSYIIAKIDEETKGSDVYDGNYLPGVSKHNITLNIGANYDRISGVLSHTYRSEAYHGEDFSNNDTQKQKAYNSTNLSLKYKWKKNYEFFAKVTNIFDYTNGLMARDSSNDHYIYPINFETTYYVGLNAKF